MTRARDLAAFVSNADGDIKFDTDTLFIDSSANRVGIGTTTPSAPLDVELGTTGTIAEFRGDSTDLLNIDGDSNAITLDARNVASLNFEMQGTEAMRIDSGGDVGIGTTSITGAFHVDKAVQGSPIATFHNTSGNTSGDAGIEVETSTTATYIQRWVNAGSEKARILANGGLTFNGDTAAANALDDYEEGTWTPSLSNHSGSTSGQTIGGRYTKVGRMCHAYGVITQGTGTVSGTLTLNGFPFNAAGTFGHVSCNSSNSSPNIQISSARIVGGTSSFSLKDYDGDGISSGSGDINICFSAVYEV